MGLRYLATHQDVSVTRDRIKLGTCFVAEAEGEIIGTITYHDPGHVKGSKWMERDNVAHLNQLAVEPDLQGHGIATRLVEHAEVYARSRGIAEIALDTAEPAHQLIAWYSKLGYRFIEYTDWEVTNYRSVVMSKSL
ncbi:MAG: GNAT family N-acetyltransferase [bacterium]|nr:GNAT family N-acetyltransferase [bacterium]